MSNTYKSLVACWCCDNKQFINIPLGKNVPKWLDEKHEKCEHCGCNDTLLFFKEYQMTQNLITRASPEDMQHDHYN